MKYDGTGGLYAKAVFGPRSKHVLRRMAADLGLRPDPNDLHVTIMYSDKHSPKVEDVEHMLTKLPVRLTSAKARISRVEVMRGHNNKQYVVLRLESVTLDALHKHFYEVGARHSYPQYNKHITLGTTEALSYKPSGIAKVNDLLKRNPFSVNYIMSEPENIKE